MRVPKYGCHNLASLLLSFWSLWTAFTSCYPLSWRPFCFRCVVMDPCFIRCHIPTQKILFTPLEQLQTALWIFEALFFLGGCEKTWHPLRKQLTHPQRFAQNCKHTTFCGVRQQRGPVEIASGPAPSVLRLGRTWLTASFGGGILLFLPWLAQLAGLPNGRVAADGSPGRTDDGRVVRDFKLKPTARGV